MYVIIYIVGFCSGFLLKSAFGTSCPEQEEGIEINASDLIKGSENNKDPQLKNIDEDKACYVFVDISGAVASPGVYCLEENKLLKDAVDKAGGFEKGFENYSR